MPRAVPSQADQTIASLGGRRPSGWKPLRPTAGSRKLRLGGHAELEAVLVGDRAQTCKVGRRVRRRRNFEAFCGLSCFPEEAVHAPGRVDSEQAKRWRLQSSWS